MMMNVVMHVMVNVTGHMMMTGMMMCRAMMMSGGRSRRGEQ
jgi:hypothetical protein